MYVMQQTEKQHKKTKIQPSTETFKLPTMAYQDGIPPSWSPNADGMPYAYNEFAWGMNRDISAIGIEWDQSWIDRTLLEFDISQSTSNISGDSTQWPVDTTFSNESNHSVIHTTNELDDVYPSPWDHLNGSLDLPESDKSGDILSISPLANFGSIDTNPLPSPDFDLALQTIDLELPLLDTHWNSLEEAFDHTNIQAYESSPLVSNSQSSILDNSDWNSMHFPLYMTPPTVIDPSSMSSSTKFPPTDTSNSKSSPAQSHITTRSSISQSFSDSSTPSSDQSASNTPSVQNEYTCTICSKTFSKRFEFKYVLPFPHAIHSSYKHLLTNPSKHQPLHTLPHLCTLCPHRTARKRDMTRHMTAKHKAVGPSGPRPASKPVCPVEDCKRDFARSDHLLRHLRRKHPGYELRS